MWDMHLDYYDQAMLTNFKCKSSEEQCAALESYLKHSFTKEVLTFKTENVLDAYEQPWAARQILGLLTYINQFAERDIETMHFMVPEGYNTAFMFFNCHHKSVREVLTKPVSSSNAQFSFSQNLLDNWAAKHE